MLLPSPVLAFLEEPVGLAVHEVKAGVVSQQHPTIFVAPNSLGKLHVPYPGEHASAMFEHYSEAVSAQYRSEVASVLPHR